jgi:hypothetical protein
MTNAACNRAAAERAFAAGLTIQQIAAEWPDVWKLDREGKLGQKYDYELADGSGRKETNRRITEVSVDQAIARLGRRS